MNKLQELGSELKLVFSEREVKVLDVTLPPVLFVAVNSFSTAQWALISAVGSAFAFFIIRLINKGNTHYALGGLAAVLLAGGFALLGESVAGYFLPGLISGGFTVLACLISILIKKPLAALTSHLTRGWPIAWYWHNKIRPAYAEVTLFWAAGFGLRLGIEYFLFLQDHVSVLVVIRIVMGWPYTILILILSYLYGTWRIKELEGPSVEEYIAEKDPPWEGQKRGF
jgi:hypothetical protein